MVRVFGFRYFFCQKLHENDFFLQLPQDSHICLIWSCWILRVECFECPASRFVVQKLVLSIMVFAFKEVPG